MPRLLYEQLTISGPHCTYLICLFHTQCGLTYMWYCLDPNINKKYYGAHTRLDTNNIRCRNYYSWHDRLPTDIMLLHHGLTLSKLDEQIPHIISCIEQEEHLKNDFEIAALEALLEFQAAYNSGMPLHKESNKNND